MGEIKITTPLSTQEQNLLKAFLHNFSLTWYKTYNRKGTSIAALLLKPDKSLSDTGYDEEILLAYSPFEALEPRALQVCEEVFADPDIFGRVDSYVFFLVCDATNVREKFSEIGSQFFATRMALAFSSDELKTNANNPWYVRQRFLDSIASRDLFDHRLPLIGDFGFFGRSDILSTIIDSVRRSENVGVFGLRKVGKTSVLFRARDICLSQDLAKVIYIDCKRPDVWGLSWEQLLHDISDRIIDEPPQLHAKSQQRHPTTRFLDVIKRSNRRILLIFDEVEFISPESTTANDWCKYFVPFWQTIWSAQSLEKKLSILVAGVNSSLLERSLIKKIQNPLFSIVKPYYLGGLKEADLRSMVRILGRKSGMGLEYDSAMWLYGRYAGHPLLTRLACSVLNNYIREQKLSRPYDVKPAFLNSCAELLDSSILYYAEHVISSLRDSFGSEYLLLEKLALGRKADFYDHAKNPTTVRHLVDYGLIKANIGEYGITIRIIQDYIASCHCLETGSSYKKWLVPAKQRDAWVNERVYRILKDFRLLDKMLQARNLSIFGPNTLPESEVFSRIVGVKSEDEWQCFINAANRTFVESVEQYGKSISKEKYLGDDVKKILPKLWHAFNRIKLYRHQEMHLVLRGNIQASYHEYIMEDIGTTALTTLGNELYFILQQGVLDGLLNALQIETARLGD